RSGTCNGATTRPATSPSSMPPAARRIRASNRPRTIERDSAGGTMTSRTSFLGRLIGLYCVLIALVMFLRKEAFVDAIGSLLGNPGAMLVLGIITLCAGLPLVLAHNVWSGGALPILVTVVGWISLLKGLMILILPPQTEL